MNRLKSVWRAVRGWKGWRYVTAVRLAGAALGLVGVGIGVWATLTTHGGAFDWLTFAQDYGANISTTLVGFTVAVLVIDVLNERRANRERKEAIIAQIGSRSNDFALDAARIARNEKWLRDGSLKKRDFWKANLKRVELVNANLAGIHLEGADLREADLKNANLQGAYLIGADLRDAQLWSANLRGANLRGAKLQGVKVEGTLLQGVYVGVTKVPDAFSLGPAHFDEETTLPDNTKWTPDTDMTRFTDPLSPVFRGDDEEEDTP